MNNLSNELIKKIVAYKGSFLELNFRVIFHVYQKLLRDLND